MTSRELERKVNLRCITHAILSVSRAINGLGVVETEALACEGTLSETMSANIADEVSRLRNVLTTLDEVRESLKGERMPIEFSEERLLNNEWMDLDTEIRRDLSAFMDPADVIKAGVDGKKACERPDCYMPVARQNGKLDMAMREFFDDDEPAPNLDERVETTVKEHGIVGFWERRDAERRFTHHKPEPNQVNAYDIIRKAGMDIALTIVGLCPTSPERDRAIDAIDMAVMWANASIARYQ